MSIEQDFAQVLWNSSLVLVLAYLELDRSHDFVLTATSVDLVALCIVFVIVYHLLFTCD